MLTSNVRKLVRKIWGSSAMAIPPRPSMRLWLEALEDRTMSSASSVFDASPPAAAIGSFMDSIVEQRVQEIATIVQYANNVWNTLGQEMVQEAASLQQQLYRILGIYPNTQAQPSNLSVTQPDSGTAKSYASGSGSGSGTTSTHATVPAQERTEEQPLTSGSGSGSPAFYSGSATVDGYVWLDNNGDGIWERNEGDNELGYGGATVNLWVYYDGTWDQDGEGDITDSDGYYEFDDVTLPNPGENQFEIQVLSPPGFEPTIPGGTSQIINAQGFTAAFNLSPGGAVQKTGGLASMTVNTTADDPNGPTQANTVTLRDAMQTGNNGGGILHLTKINFTGNGASGTITLQAALPAIKGGYYIIGPTNSSVTVNGNNNAGTIFTLNAGYTSEISNLTITGGYGQSGGGIFNSGSLTLANDNIVNNSTPNGGNGGGILNTKGLLNVNSTNVTKNKAVPNTQMPKGVLGGLGGGLYNVGGGAVTISASDFDNNRASNGGGIFNANDGGGGSTVRIKNGTTIDYNIVTGGGGGVDNSFGTVTMSGGSIYENSSGAGGGIYTVEGTTTLWNVYLYANFAQTGNGGGILENNGNVTLIGGGTVQGNRANNGQGGGIYVMNGNLFLRGGELIGGGNTAITGGGLYLAGGQTFFSGVTVSGNKATNPTNTAPGVAYTTNGDWGPKPPNLTDDDDPGGNPVQV
jgi:hypothetical protein